MALKMDVVFDQAGVTVAEAYVRVEQVQRNRFHVGMDCVARCYKSDPGFPPTMPAFKDLMFSVPYDSAAGDAFAQAYVGAKQLPEFASATSC